MKFRPFIMIIVFTVTVSGCVSSSYDTAQTKKNQSRETISAVLLPDTEFWSNVLPDQLVDQDTINKIREMKITDYSQSSEMMCLFHIMNGYWACLDKDFLLSRVHLNQAMALVSRLKDKMLLNGAYSLQALLKIEDKPTGIKPDFAADRLGNQLRKVMNASGNTGETSAWIRLFEGYQAYKIKDVSTAVDLWSGIIEKNQYPPAASGMACLGLIHIYINKDRLKNNTSMFALSSEQAHLAVSKADRFFKKAGSPRGRAKAFILKGRLEYSENLAHQAKKSFDNARSIFRKIGYKKGLMKVDHAQATCEIIAGSHQAAWEILSQSRKSRDSIAYPVSEKVMQEFIDLHQKYPSIMDIDKTVSLEKSLDAMRRFYHWADTKGDPAFIIPALTNLIICFEKMGYVEDVIYYRQLRKTVYDTYRKEVSFSDRLKHSARIDFSYLTSTPGNLVAYKYRKKSKSDIRFIHTMELLYRAMAEKELEMTDKILNRTTPPSDKQSAIDFMLKEHKQYWVQIEKALNRCIDGLKQMDFLMYSKAYSDLVREFQSYRRYKNRNNVFISQKKNTGKKSILHKDEQGCVLEYTHHATHIIESPDYSSGELLHLDMVEDYLRNILIAGFLQDEGFLDGAVSEIIFFYDKYDSSFTPPVGIDLPSIFEYDHQIDPVKILEKPQAAAERKIELETALNKFNEKILEEHERSFCKDIADEFGLADTWNDTRYLDDNYRLVGGDIDIKKNRAEKVESADGMRVVLDFEYDAKFFLRKDSAMKKVPEPENIPDMEKRLIQSKNLVPLQEHERNIKTDELIQSFRTARLRDSFLNGFFGTDTLKLAAAASVFHRLITPGQAALDADTEQMRDDADQENSFTKLSRFIASSETLEKMLRQMADAQSRFLYFRTEDNDAEANIIQSLDNIFKYMQDFIGDQNLTSLDNLEIGDMGRLSAFISILSYPELIYALLNDTAKMKQTGDMTRLLKRQVQKALKEKTKLSSEQRKRVRHAQTNIALHYLLNGSYKKSIEELWVLEKLIPDNEHLTHYQVSFLTAACYQRLNNLEKEIEYLFDSIGSIDIVRNGLRSRQMVVALGPLRRTIYGRLTSCLQRAKDIKKIGHLMSLYKQPALLPAGAIAGSSGSDNGLTQRMLENIIFLFDVLSKTDVHQKSNTAEEDLLNLMSALLGGKDNLSAVNAESAGQGSYKTSRLSILNTLCNILVSETTSRVPDTEIVKSRFSSVIPENGLLISYLAAENGIHCFTINKQGEIHSFFSPVQIARLAEWVEAFRSDILKPYKKFSSSAGHNLFKILIQPIQNMNKYDRLYFWLDGPIAQIPFQALRKNDKSPYLIEHHTISFLIGKMGTYNQHNRSPEKQKILILANPDGTLIDAEAEAEHISQVAQRASIPLIGKDATLRNLSHGIQQAKWVHFASHAKFDAENQNFSFLQLADRNRLYSINLGNISFYKRNVFLSGCETGLGEYLPGEDLYSLANSFLSAGADAVISSLWKIESRSASRFVQEFYSFSNVDDDPGDALAEVSRDFIGHNIWIEKGGRAFLLDHPYYWAAFSLLQPISE